jgi:hypothetical protein
MLHSLDPGGSTWQWVRLLGRHVEAGGGATLLGPPGPLAQTAEAAGIEVIPARWDEEERGGWGTVTEIAERSDLAIVHWDFEVMDAFGPALEACGRAALVVHQMPLQMVRWHGPEVMAGARAALEQAMADPAAAVFVRGSAHRRIFETAFGLREGELRTLPVSFPLPPFSPAQGRNQILALTRHSPEKASIPRLAVELTREGIARGRECRLTVAGEGPTREQVEAVCAERLPPGTWRFEGPPPDPIARLAAAEIVVAQGSTTLEATALGRRVVVARRAGKGNAAGIVLRPECYEAAARDPFGDPEVTTDPGALWDELLEIEDGELRDLRRLVEAHNSLDAAAAALRDAVAATALASRRETAPDPRARVRAGRYGSRSRPSHPGAA